MAGGAVDIGTGATIAFATGFFAQITDINWSGISRPAIDTSHMGISASGAGKFGEKTFMPGDLVDPGELTVEMHFNPITDPPIGDATETMTLTFPTFSGDSTGTTYACDGFFTDWEFSVPLEDKMVATATLKLSGNVTITDAT